MSGAWRGLWVSLLILVSGACHGGALEVTPVLHELPALQPALSMSVANRGVRGATVQVRVFSWTQEDGRERLTPLTDVILSPAIFTLDAGRMQTVRVLFPEGEAPHERSYRILIDELPDVNSTEPVRFALRLSVPVFRQPAVAPPPPSLAWQLEAGVLKLVARNEGGRRERLRDLVLTSEHGQQVKPTTPWGHYLLAGHQRSWSIDGSNVTWRPGERWTLVAQTDAGRIEVPLVVAP